MIDIKNPTNTFTFQPAGRDEPVNIRTTQIDGEPWFVAADVCRALGLQPDHVTKMRSAFRPAELRTISRSETLPGGVSAADLFGETHQGGARRLRLLTESALYKLIMRSDKREAQAFQDWLASTVLPSIRKTGGYLLNESARATAQADTREAMPLPMDLAEAMATAMRPVVEELASLKALLAATLEKREADSMDELKRNQMFAARDLKPLVRLGNS